MYLFGFAALIELGIIYIIIYKANRKDIIMYKNTNKNPIFRSNFR